MIKIAEQALNAKSSLKKVVIVLHTPRFDNQTFRNLAETANRDLINLREKSSLKDQIFIGQHSLKDFGIGKTHNHRYLNSATNQYDGVHYFGPFGCQEYTKSLANMLLTATSSNNSPICSQPLLMGNC